MNVSALDRPGAEVKALRDQLATSERTPGPVLPFSIADLDDRLVGGGLDGAGLHEVAAASSNLSDDAAATLFVAGIAARFAGLAGKTVLWSLTRFDLYAPGLEQAGLAPACLLYAQGRKDSDVLAIAEDGLRDGSLACVIAEVKAADRTATRRLQLAASDRDTPILLYRRHRTPARCPLDVPSSAMTRWRIGCTP
ncbi:MAG TPA: protein ImuA, partial [Sphingomicrobium sp.]